jgi:hypothetical protein|tara:strand:+ start:28 stop:1059 length:1032 start_codon:yes stop_codon:yes gene_type:complete
MANMNIRKPRFYVDRVNYLLNRGRSISQSCEIQATSTGNNTVGLKSGSVVADLIDMKPLNQATFDTSASATTQADTVVTRFDFAFGSYRTNFIAILNHNMKSADAKFKVGYGTESQVETIGFTGGTVITPTVALNGTVGSNVVTPQSDGHTLITFTSAGSSDWGIQFEGSDGSNFDGTNDLKIGCILIGEYYDMPHSPDLSVKRSIKFDKAKIQESLGGQRYSNMSSYGKIYSSDQSKSPFHDYTSNGERGMYGGRISYDMKFSYLNSTDIMPDDYSSFNDNSVVDDIWSATHGSHTPFIFTQDGTSTSESDYLFARFAQNSLDMTQVAPDVFNIAMKIEEEF